MNSIDYPSRAKVYLAASAKYGRTNQIIVALEELSEVQKELCKMLRDIGDSAHLAEEIADATIVLEQMRMMFGLNDAVCEQMDYKIERLTANITERG